MQASLYILHLFDKRSIESRTLLHPYRPVFNGLL
jgi:hypothetical protein